MIAIPILAFLVIAMVTNLETALIYGVFLLVNLGAFLMGKSLPNRTLYLFAMINMVLLLIALTNTGAMRIMGNYCYWFV